MKSHLGRSFQVLKGEMAVHSGAPGVGMALVRIRVRMIESRDRNSNDTRVGSSGFRLGRSSEA